MSMARHHWLEDLTKRYSEERMNLRQLLSNLSKTCFVSLSTITISTSVYNPTRKFPQGETTTSQ
jgi:hypothetical protein